MSVRRSRLVLRMWPAAQLHKGGELLRLTPFLDCHYPRTATPASRASSSPAKVQQLRALHGGEATGGAGGGGHEQLNHGLPDILGQPSSSDASLVGRPGR